MIIDYSQLEEKKIEKFKGGIDHIIARMYVDDNNRVLFGTLEPGASIGFHKHEGSSELVYILSGKGKALYDDSEERLEPGTCHYCPENHGHSLINDGTDNLVFFAVVPQHENR